MVEETKQKRFQVAVVGGGPAGLAAVGVLLEEGCDSVLWIDPYFEGGRLVNFHHVPSNTKSVLFLRYATELDCFRRAWKAHPEMTIVERVRMQAQDRGCSVGLAATMVKDLSLALRLNEHPRLLSMRARCTSLLQISDRLWELGLLKEEEEEEKEEKEKEEMEEVEPVEKDQKKISLQTEKHQYQQNGKPHSKAITFQATKVILATGSSPRSPPSLDVCPPSIITLNPEDLLEPSKLHTLLLPSDKVAVVGSSHSAMLILRNIAQMPLAHRPKSLLNLYRAPLKYAHYLSDGSILHDNTGLKGEVAEWAKENLRDSDGHDDQPVLCLDGLMRRIRLPMGSNDKQEACEQRILQRELATCTKLIWAIGYVRDPLPSITDRYGNSVQASSYSSNAQLVDQQGQPIEALYGMGIAFPERVLDLDNVTPELAVGLWKFLNHAKRLVPTLLRSSQSQSQSHSQTQTQITTIHPTL